MTMMNSTILTTIDTSRLITRSNFASVYWEIVRELTVRQEKFTNLEVFEALNELRRKTYGEAAFPSSSAFFMWLKRRN